MIHDHSRKRTIAICALATLLHKRQLLPIEEAKATAQKKILPKLSFSSAQISSVASIGAQYFSYTDIVFPIANISLGTSSILLGSDHIIALDMLHPQTPLVIMERRAADCLYRDRVKQQDHRSLTWQKSGKSENGKIVDHDEQIRIGANAEHFFFRYLQKEYGSDYVTPTRNWCSSNRQKLFPSCLCDIDDTVGYDFILHDKKEVFVRGTNALTKQCYFEVKGTSDPFDLQQTRFHISENERRACKAIASDALRKENEAYLIVLVENCLDPENIGLAALITW